ncbi:protein MAIN-LIKE 2-like [Gossypium raimondii]|uniref:protein MAIN-LIKE 2-like n=1 Tax=Gossypium raimondii TaxID=29730 RepID=UPI00227A4A60|nr:protein MAIN-LIKE 2-like [Gossypium raimondii]
MTLAAVAAVLPLLLQGPYRVLRGRVNNVGFLSDERLIPYLELVGFRSAALIWTFDLRHDSISALVERWRPKTHTFHLPCGECTVTLEDVALQLGLPIDGNAVTSLSSISRLATFCYELLGRSSSEGKFTSLRFSWIKVNFKHLPSTADEWEVMQAVRAYIMHLIGGVLMPDANGSKVYLIWSTNPGIGRTYTIPIYHLMIENHTGEAKLWQLSPHLPTSTQTYGAVAHPLSIFR